MRNQFSFDEKYCSPPRSNIWTGRFDFYFPMAGLQQNITRFQKLPWKNQDDDHQFKESDLVVEWTDTSRTSRDSRAVSQTGFYHFMFQKLSISNCKSAHFVFICTSMNICVFTMWHGLCHHYLLLYIAKNKFNIIFENCLDIIFNIFRLENNDSFGTWVYIHGHKPLDDRPKPCYRFHLIRLCAEYGLLWFILMKTAVQAHKNYRIRWFKPFSIPDRENWLDFFLIEEIAILMTVV